MPCSKYMTIHISEVTALVCTCSLWTIESKQWWVSLKTNWWSTFAKCCNICRAHIRFQWDDILSLDIVCTVQYGHNVGLTWSTLRQALEMLTIFSCMEMRSLTRSRIWDSSKTPSWSSEMRLSSWRASSKHRSLHLFTLLLFVQNHSVIMTAYRNETSSQTCWGHGYRPGGFREFFT